jgi:hypothetical protein
MRQDQTPKEKAKELLSNYMKATNETSDFRMELYHHIQTAKQCAIIAVDEIINAIKYTDAKKDLGYVGFWSQVKQEIEKS